MTYRRLPFFASRARMNGASAVSHAKASDWASRIAGVVFAPRSLTTWARRASLDSRMISRSTRPGVSASNSASSVAIKAITMVGGISEELGVSGIAKLHRSTPNGSLSDTVSKRSPTATFGHIGGVA